MVEIIIQSGATHSFRLYLVDENRENIESNAISRCKRENTIPKRIIYYNHNSRNLQQGLTRKKFNEGLISKASTKFNFPLNAG